MHNMQSKKNNFIELLGVFYLAMVNCLPFSS